MVARHLFDSPRSIWPDAPYRRHPRHFPPDTRPAFAWPAGDAAMLREPRWSRPAACWTFRELSLWWPPLSSPAEANVVEISLI